MESKRRAGLRVAKSSVATANDEAQAAKTTRYEGNKGGVRIQKIRGTR